MRQKGEENQHLGTLLIGEGDQMSLEVMLFGNVESLIPNDRLLVGTNIVGTDETPTS